MLTGVLPFEATDPMEWVHCHIARQPIPPAERLKGIPEPVSAIIMKLLAKNAEERYQTAAGVEADFWKCLAEWESLGRIQPFLLGGLRTAKVCSCLAQLAETDVVTHDSRGYQLNPASNQQPFPFPCL